MKFHVWGTLQLEKLLKGHSIRKVSGLECVLYKPTDSYSGNNMLRFGSSLENLVPIDVVFIHPTWCPLGEMFDT